MSLATQELTAVSEKWEYIGEELGVEQYLLWNIRTKHSDPGDCLREVLRKRLRNCATTWGDIIAVLRSPRIGDFQLADNLSGGSKGGEHRAHSPPSSCQTLQGRRQWYGRYGHGRTGLEGEKMASLGF